MGLKSLNSSLNKSLLDVYIQYTMLVFANNSTPVKQLLSKWTYIRTAKLRGKLMVLRILNNIPGICRKNVWRTSLNHQFYDFVIRVENKLVCFAVVCKSDFQNNLWYHLTVAKYDPLLRTLARGPTAHVWVLLMLMLLSDTLVGHQDNCYWLHHLTRAVLTLSYKGSSVIYFDKMSPDIQLLVSTTTILFWHLETLQPCKLSNVPILSLAIMENKLHGVQKAHCVQPGDVVKLKSQVFAGS